MTGTEHPRRKKLLGVIVGIVVVVALVGGGMLLLRDGSVQRKIAAEQSLLDPFYTPPDQVPAEPGTIIRSEVMTNIDLSNGTAYRILYTSLDISNKPVAVGGMIFMPKAAPPKNGQRKVVAWAHPTVGLANQCAPSRSSNPLHDTSGWLGLMMDHGWVVAASDYYGLGVPGPKTYLMGQQEAKDVVNSVRAARNFKDSSAGREWIVWGHSQGGHSSLWTAALAEQIAPELKLLAVGAAAPAQQLKTIIDQQWANDIGWVIGVEATVSFSDNYPQFQLGDSLSVAGRRKLESLNEQCVVPAAVRGMILEEIDGPLFTGNPLENPQWVMVATQQTPPQPPKSMPMFLSEGTKDEVVLSGTNAKLQELWCRAGVNLTVEWLGGVGHMAVANASGPAFVEWADGRFQGEPAQPNCQFPPASKPLPEPTIAPDVQRQADELLKQYPLPPIKR